MSLAPGWLPAGKTRGPGWCVHLDIRWERSQKISLLALNVVVGECARLELSREDHLPRIQHADLHCVRDHGCAQSGVDAGGGGLRHCCNTICDALLCCDVPPTSRSLFPRAPPIRVTAPALTCRSWDRTQATRSLEWRRCSLRCAVSQACELRRAPRAPSSTAVMCGTAHKTTCERSLSTRRGQTAQVAEGARRETSLMKIC